MIELLVVMAIITLLIVLLIPSIKDLGGGVNMTAAGEEIAWTISLARQRATAYNRNIAVRFYAGSSDADAPYKSYQIWEQLDLTDANSWRGAEREQHLGVGLMINPHGEFSPILNLARFNDEQGRSYASIFFTPSGSITAPRTKASLTLHPEYAAREGGLVAGLPPNFSVISIEPFNGRARIFRP